MDGENEARLVWLLDVDFKDPDFSVGTIGDKYMLFKWTTTIDPRDLTSHVLQTIWQSLTVAIDPCVPVGQAVVDNRRAAKI